MTNWSKSGFFGGIYPVPFRGKETKNKNHSIKSTLISAEAIHLGSWTRPEINQMEKALKIANSIWEKSKRIYLFIRKNLKSHFSAKQEVYWPVLIAILLLLFVFVSKVADAKTAGTPNNLPIKDNSGMNLFGLGKPAESIKVCQANMQDGKNSPVEKRAEDTTVKNTEKSDENRELKDDVSKIVKNTPMDAMVDSISEKDRTVAAFIVGIAMKESKFGVYSPKLSGRDCFNYWGFKGGGKTVSGGYTCFASPEDAVDAVAKRIEKMVDKGVRNPAQAISWKCGSSCKGHDPAGVRKWISDVAINFNKINS